MADDKVLSLPKSKDEVSLLTNLNKYFKAPIAQFADDAAADEKQVFKYSTGILSLDKYLQIGGILGGKVVECIGHEGCGKTLTALTVAARIQKTPVTHPSNSTGFGRVVFLDLENTFSIGMAKAVGCDTSRLIVLKNCPEMPLTGEKSFDILNILIQQGTELIIVDSVPSMQPGSRVTANIGEGQKATHANMMAEGLRNVEFFNAMHKHSIVWLINQYRMKPMAMFGSPEGPAGGEKLKYAKSLSLKVRKIADITKQVQDKFGGWEKRKIGCTIKLEAEKNKFATIPEDPVEFDIYFENVQDSEGLVYTAGVDLFKDVTEVGVQCNVITQTSSWYSFGKIKENGKDKFLEALRHSPDTMEEIRKAVLGQYA